MQIRHLQIENFRGIANLAWSPDDNFCCLIGRGDSGKSTILDALDAALNAKWLSFSESDFLQCDTRNNIKIEVTVGELSDLLKSDDRFGFYIRGWTSTGNLHDEPENDDEPVLTIRLSVDSTLEPVWEMVCDRASTPRTLSNRDRALFGLVRLAGDDARHLTWSQGSVLSRLTGDGREVAATLSEAYRAACLNANLHTVSSLAAAASEAELHAKALGAYADGAYAPGLALGRSGLSPSIALHDGDVPLRLAGLGTRRLATLGIQKSAIKDGAIILIDEIEHGLEPHRIIGAMSQLRRDLTPSKDNQDVASVGQVLMTTHSDIVLGETDGSGVYVVNMSRSDRTVTLKTPKNIPQTSVGNEAFKSRKKSDPIQALLRYAPRAMFARRILVVEGMTEVGLLTGFSEIWTDLHDNKSISQLGVAITDGHGSNACLLALSLAGLGYTVAMFRDSDVPFDPTDVADLLVGKVPVFEYGELLNTEQALLKDADDTSVQKLLDYAREKHGNESLNNYLRGSIPCVTQNKNNTNFSEWAKLESKSGSELRTIIANVMSKKSIFKDRIIGRGLAQHAWGIAKANPTSTLALTLADIERWVYG